MIKKIVTVFIVLFMLGFCSHDIYGDSEKDYKVIKNAIKKKKKEIKGNFCILVKDIKEGDTKFKLTVPLSVIEMFVENSDSDYSFGEGNSFNARKVLKMLKKSGKSSAVEVRGDESIIRVWVE